MPTSYTTVTAGKILIACGLMLAVLLMPARCPAAVGPTRPASPTGCASDIFSLKLDARPAWGVVPFETVLSVRLRSGADSVENVWWDFDGDGAVDAAGLEVVHTISHPVDHRVTATVRTSRRDDLEVKTTVSGYVAIMSLTFDDGCSSVHRHARPLLEARGVTGTAYIAPSWIKDWGATYMSWEDLRDLADLGWDIGSHTMTHISLEGADDSTLHYELYASRDALRARGFEAANFSFPFGRYDERAMEEVRRCYESSRVVGNALNPPVEFADPYALLSKTGQPWLTIDQYRSDIDSVAAAGGWYILNNHRVQIDCYASEWCITTETLAGVLDHAIANRIKVANIAEVLAYRRVSEENSRLPGGPGDDAVGRQRVAWTFANPFRAPGQIEFTLPSPAAPEVCIYDSRGRLVRDIEYGPQHERAHRVTWDGLNSEGEPVASGAYYCVISAGHGTHSSGPILIVR